MMKNIFILLSIASFMAVISCKDKKDLPKVILDSNKNVMPQDKFGNVIVPKKIYKKGEYPAITIKDQEFDFGTIKQGDVVEHTFSFKNTGKNDLIIMNAQASCGCTVPEWTNGFIKPSDQGEIKIKFNSAGKMGQVTKTVTLTTNTEAGAEIISFKVNIIK